MKRILTAARTPSGWCLSLLLTEFVLSGAPPATNTPAGAPISARDIPAPARLSLGEAQRVAFQRNWDLLAAKSGIDFATAQLLVAKEFPNPNLSWSTLKIDPHGNGTALGNSLWD